MNSAEMIERVAIAMFSWAFSSDCDCDCDLDDKELWSEASPAIRDDYRKTASVAIAEYDACREEAVAVEIQQMYMDARI